MTALERIKNYNEQLPKDYVCQMCGFHSEEQKFLLRAFNEMREMCKEYADQSWHRGDDHELNLEFEERMKEGK